MSRLPIPRHPITATARLDNPSRAGTPRSSAARDMNVTEVDPTARPFAPYIGRSSTGWGVGVDEVGELADLDRAHLVRETVRDGGVDRVFGDVPFDARVVVARRLPRQAAALELHLVRGLPRPDGDLPDPPHRLRVGRHDADRAQVVQDVLGRDRLPADARLRERE